MFVAATLFMPAVSFAATLNVLPAAISVSAGEVFTETVSVSSADQALNATSGTVTFPASLLSVSSVSSANSILTLWVQQPTFSNYLGTVRWSGVVPNPGFTGIRGQIFSIRFVAKSAGTAAIGLSSPMVLANDGNGTNIFTAANPASVSISPSAPQPANATPQNQSSVPLAAITSSTHPDQTEWYSSSHVALDWTNAPGVTALRLGYDQDANGLPTTFYSNLISHQELQLGDGIWYFHVQERNSDGWGPVSTFRIQIDTVPPLPVLLQFPNGTTTAASTIAVQFTTTDALSGIDHYQLSVDGRSFEVIAQDGSGVYMLPSGSSGMHTLSVTAYDRAGNSATAQEQFSTLGGTPITFSISSFIWLIANYLSLILIAIAALAVISFAGWYLWHRLRAFRMRLYDKLDPAHQALRQEFTKLNGAIVQEVLSLEKIKSERPLTQEEGQIIAHLRRIVEKPEPISGNETNEIADKDKKQEEHHE